MTWQHPIIRLSEYIYRGARDISIPNYQHTFAVASQRSKGCQSCSILPTFDSFHSQQLADKQPL